MLYFVYFRFLFDLTVFSLLFSFHFFSLCLVQNVCSKSDDAIVYGDFNENFLQREAGDIGLFEFSADYHRCCDCNNDWAIIRHDGTNLCAIGHTWIFPTKYFLEKSTQRHRHPSFAAAACARAISIDSIPTGVAVHGLFPNHTRADNCKLEMPCVALRLLMDFRDMTFCEHKNV